MGFHKVSNKENEDLIKISLEDEIKDFTLALHPLEALSPDGFSRIF